MATTLINLRAWREDRRQARQRTFASTSFLFLILAAVTVFGTGFYIESQTDKQLARNDFLREEIKTLDTRVKEIKELKEKRARLLERLQAIQELQGNRPVIVRVFDDLVRVMPEDLWYKTLNRRGEQISIDGSAKTNKDVSQLMRNLDRSPWFSEPNLKNVGRGPQHKTYQLQVGLSKPKPEDG